MVIICDSKKEAEKEKNWIEDRKGKAKIKKSKKGKFKVIEIAKPEPEKEVYLPLG